MAEMVRKLETEPPTVEVSQPGIWCCVDFGNDKNLGLWMKDYVARSGDGCHCQKKKNIFLKKCKLSLRERNDREEEK